MEIATSINGDVEIEENDFPLFSGFMISGKGEKPLLDYRMFLRDEEKTNNEEGEQII